MRDEFTGPAPHVLAFVSTPADRAVLMARAIACVVLLTFAMKDAGGGVNGCQKGVFHNSPLTPGCPIRRFGAWGAGVLALAVAPMRTSCGSLHCVREAMRTTPKTNAI